MAIGDSNIFKPFVFLSLLILLAFQKFSAKDFNVLLLLCDTHFEHYKMTNNFNIGSYARKEEKIHTEL